MLRKKASVKRKIQTEAEKEQNVGLMVKYPAEGKAGKDHKKLAWLPLALVYAPLVSRHPHVLL